MRSPKNLVLNDSSTADDTRQHQTDLAYNFGPTEIAWNKIKHGDALKVLPAISHGGIFDIVIADPPYNIGKDFGNNKDSLLLGDYVQWTHKWLTECFRLLKPSGLIYMYGLPEILAHISVSIPINRQRWLAWHYTNKTVPTSKFWQRSYESILCLWREARPALNIDEIREPYTEQYKKCAGKIRRETHCRYSSKGLKTIYQAHPRGALPRDVIKISALAGGAGYVERWFLCRSCNMVCEPRQLRQHRFCDIVKHPTQKPKRLAEKLLSSVVGYSDGDCKVLIPFAGSGSECVVAEQLGLSYYGIEKNREYIRLAEGWLNHVRTG